MLKKGKLSKVVAITFVLHCVVYLTSCDYSYFEETPSYTYSPEFVIPLVSSSVEISDFLLDIDSTMVHIDGDNFITLIIEHQVMNISGKDAFLLPGQFFSFIEGINESNIDSQPIEGQQTFYFDVAWMHKIDSLDFISGLLEAQVDSPGLIQDGVSYDVNILIPGLTNALGSPLTLNVSGNETEQISLQGHSLALYEDGSEANSLFDVFFSIEIQGDIDSDHLPHDMIFSISLTDLEYDIIFGDVEVFQLDFVEDHFDIDLFQTYQEGGIVFANPEIGLTARNSFGFDIGMLIEDLSGERDETMVSLEGYPFPWHLPAIPPDQIGETEESRFYLNEDNSNLADFIHLYPTTVHYKIGAEMAGGQSASGNFINHDGELSLDVSLNLPLDVSILGYVFGNDVPFSLAGDLEEIGWVEFKVDVLNGLPLGAELQIYFLDEDDNVLTHLFDTGNNSINIGPAGVDDNGIVSDEHEFSKHIYISQEKLDKMQNAENIAYSVRLQTSGSGDIPVKIFSDYSMEIFIGMKTALSIDL